MAEVLRTAATLGGALALVLTVYRGLNGWWRRTFGSRRHVAGLLNRLACGVTSDYVEELFGKPAFRRVIDEAVVEHTYSTKHAWLQVMIRVADQSVSAFAITATDPRFRFHTRSLTFDHLDVRLGQTRLGDVKQVPDGARIDIGARRSLYAQTYYFGNPGGYQHFVLAQNDAGVTKEVGIPAGVEPCWAGGFMRRPDDLAQGPDLVEPPPLVGMVLQRAVVNTLVVINSQLEHLLGRTWVGVDQDHVRLLMTPAEQRRARALRRRLDREMRGQAAKTQTREGKRHWWRQGRRELQDPARPAAAPGSVEGSDEARGGGL